MHIWKKAFVALAAAAVFAGAAIPKDAAKDAKSSDVVGNVAKNIGANDLKTIQYSGSGFAYAFGQSYLPGGPYPKFYAKYSREIDFDKRLSSEDTTRTQFENPPRGGGGQPLYRPSRGVAVSGPDSAWGGGAVELTPQGWTKAAMEASPTMKSAKVNGKPGTLVTFMHGKYKIEGYVDGDNLLEKVDTWTPNPILGDMLIETTYSDYKDFGGIKFPTKIAQSQGGHPVLEITVADVQPNAAVSIKPPNAPPPTHVDAQKIGDGVWYLAGTPDPNAMAIEFKDYVVVIESSVTEARALANIAKVKELVPNKPIRYHINSHHHSDHAAGLRAFVAEGSTIITHESNKDYYEKTVLKNSHALDPDRLTQESQAGEVHLGEGKVRADRRRPHARCLLGAWRGTHVEPAYVLSAERADSLHHRHLQPVRSAAAERSAAGNRHALLRRPRRQPEAPESRSSADCAVSWQGSRFGGHPEEGFGRQGRSAAGCATDDGTAKVGPCLGTVARTMHDSHRWQQTLSRDKFIDIVRTGR